MNPSAKQTNCLLLVDDDDDMIAIGEQVFAKAGYQFVSAASGEAGLATMLKYKPEIVLVDYLLPDMKGEDIIKYVASEKKYAGLRGTPFVILTAWEESLRDINQLYALGLKAYLTKPFGHRELRCVVDNIVALNRIERKLGRLSDEHTRQGALDDDALDLVRSLVVLSKQLLESTQGELSERQTLDLDAIHNCGVRLLKLIEPDVKTQPQTQEKKRALNYGG